MFEKTIKLVYSVNILKFKKFLSMDIISSNKRFGILFFVVFVLIAILPVFKGDPLRVWSIILAFIFLILGLLKPDILTPLNKVWVKFGTLIGKFFAPIILAIIFFVIITPIGIFMRLIGKDLLNTKLTQQKSYWIKRVKNIGPMKRQF